MPRRAKTSQREEEAVVEALLYASSRPVTVERVMRALGLSSREEAYKIIKRYVESFNKFHTSVKVVEISRGKFILYLLPEWAERVRRYVVRIRLGETDRAVLAYVLKKEAVELRELAAVFGPRAYRSVKKLATLGYLLRRRRGRTVVVKVPRDLAEVMAKELRAKNRY